MKWLAPKLYWVRILILVVGSSLTGSASAQKSDVLGEIQLEGKTDVEKTSGVWVDGQYVGYLKELKGSKRILLLPGEHTISVRQNSYQDFIQKVTVQPGETQIIRVSMEKAPTGPMPPDAELATIKLNVNPSKGRSISGWPFRGACGRAGGHWKGPAGGTGDSPNPDRTSWVYDLPDRHQSSAQAEGRSED